MVTGNNIFISSLCSVQVPAISGHSGKHNLLIRPWVSARLSALVGVERFPSKDQPGEKLGFIGEYDDIQ